MKLDSGVPNKQILITPSAASALLLGSVESHLVCKSGSWRRDGIRRSGHGGAIAAIVS
ncbi:hypothetical protein [Flavihumibacter sp. UBA7668]|uniref:hypothetical protein n=1 Tax=Flavihumibacter sp. UBA7668 TaxID=1946542 RepID=UPI0025BBA27D|nr:hypothetical protein [Flavihumibacter sp. UBA7668]